MEPVSVGDLSGKPTLSPELLARIADNKEAAKRRKASKRANLSPEMVANIVAKREAAKMRKAAKAAGQAELLPIDLQCLTACSDKTAPTTGPREGGRPQISRKRDSDKPANYLHGPNAWTWPNDQSLSMADDTHRRAGWWAIDTVNPNSWQAGSSYMEASAADVIRTQELKVPDGYPREQAEQTARNSKWSLAIEPCLVSKLGGRSAGTSVAVRSFIGMSEPTAVTA